MEMQVRSLRFVYTVHVALYQCRCAGLHLGSILVYSYSCILRCNYGKNENIAACYPHIHPHLWAQSELQRSVLYQQATNLLDQHRNDGHNIVISIVQVIISTYHLKNWM